MVRLEGINEVSDTPHRGAGTSTASGWEDLAVEKRLPKRTRCLEAAIWRGEGCGEKRRGHRDGLRRPLMRRRVNRDRRHMVTLHARGSNSSVPQPRGIHPRVAPRPIERRDPKLDAGYLHAPSAKSLANLVHKPPIETRRSEAPPARIKAVEAPLAERAEVRRLKARARPHCHRHASRRDATQAHD